MDPFLLLIVVMLVAGAFGGLIGFLLAPDETRSFWRSILTGIAASFMVPLFLNMISSNLIELIKGKSPDSGDMSKILVFAGFCLIAAISSRAFIATLSDRILREATEARKDAKKAEEKVAEMERTVAPIIDAATESESGSDATSVMFAAERGESKIAENEKQVLRAFVHTPFVLRSSKGLAGDTGLNSQELAKTLRALSDKNWIAQTTRENGPRFFVTDKGRGALRHIQQALEDNRHNAPAGG